MTNEYGHRSVSRRDLLRLGGRAVATVAVGSLAAGCTLLDALDDERYAVTITDGVRFEPTSLTVPVGATVVWRNMDENPHTVSTDADQLDEPVRVSIPEGAEPWDSGDIVTGTQFAHTFIVPGTYVYTCRYHQDAGMIGTVTVEEEGD